MNPYETEWFARDRLDQARAHTARRALIRLARSDRPTWRFRLATLLIRLGTWLLREGTGEPDVEAKRAAA